MNPVLSQKWKSAYTHQAVCKKNLKVTGHFSYTREDTFSSQIYTIALIKCELCTEYLTVLNIDNTTDTDKRKFKSIKFLALY